MYTLLDDRKFAQKINEYLASNKSATKREIIKKFYTTKYRLNMLIEEGLVSFEEPKKFYKYRWDGNKKNQVKIPQTLKWYVDRYKDGSQAI